MNDGRWGEGLSSTSAEKSRKSNRLPLFHHHHGRLSFPSLPSPCLGVLCSSSHWVARRNLLQIERHEINLQRYLLYATKQGKGVEQKNWPNYYYFLKGSARFLSNSLHKILHLRIEWRIFLQERFLRRILSLSTLSFKWPRCRLQEFRIIVTFCNHPPLALLNIAGEFSMISPPHYSALGGVRVVYWMRFAAGHFIINTSCQWNLPLPFPNGHFFFFYFFCHSAPPTLAPNNFEFEVIFPCIWELFVCGVDPFLILSPTFLPLCLAGRPLSSPSDLIWPISWHSLDMYELGVTE